MKTILYFLLPIVLFSNCTKIIELDLNDEESKKLVVDAWFTTAPKAHEVKLTLTTSYFQNEVAPTVSGATVYVTDGITNIPFNEVEPGVYRTDPTAKANFNTTYTLHIDYDGEIYEAEAYIDSVSPIDSLSASPGYDYFGDYYGMDINIWTQELPESGDYYLWRVYVNDVLETDTLNELDFESDEFLVEEGMYFAEWPITTSYKAVSGDTVKLEQQRISKLTYDVIMAMMLETDWRGGIFDAPPANPETNLTNGAVGFFIAAAETSNTCIVP